MAIEFENHEETVLSEELFQLAITAAKLGHWTLDLRTSELTCSEICKSHFGRTPDQSFSYSEFLSVVHDDDRASVQLAVERSISNRTVYDAEYRVVWPDESVHWVLARGRASYAAEGHPLSFSGVTLDVTDRKQAEAALRASERRWHLALDSADLGAWSVDPATSTLTTDRRFRMIFRGHDAEMTYEEAFDAMHPDDRQRVREAVAAATTPDNPTPYSVQHRVVHRNGETRWLDVRGRSNFEETASGRRLSSFDGTVADITARKRTEDSLREARSRLESTLAAGEIGTWEFDIVSNSVRADHNLARMFGVSPEAADAGPLNVFTKSIHPDDLARVSRVIETAINRGDTYECEYRIVVPDEPLRWVVSRGRVERDAKGQAIRLPGVVVDITERKRAEEELRRLAADLSEANRRKTEFLATLGHELRNPLAPIRTGLELMSYLSDDPETMEETRGMMVRQTQQMVRLIDDLLDVSRITQGKLELRTCRVNLHHVVTSAVEATRSQIEEAGHHLSISMPPDPIELEADPNRLAQIISNLLNNSSKYTPDGGQIQLTVEQHDGEAFISITDNGIGIPAHHQDDIFEMFNQIDRPFEDGYRGLGIGLTLVKQLVEMHGGSISVHSEGDHLGSEFTVRIPVSSHAHDAPLTVPDDPPEHTSSRLKVLVVDDNADAAIMLSMVIKMLGHEVRTAHDGFQGVDTARIFHPDVVLMDLGMPRMTGYEAARTIRQQPWGQDMVLVALTGWGQQEDRDRTQQAGFDHHLVKPAEPATLQKLFAQVQLSSR